MLRKKIKFLLFLPISLYITSQKAISNEIKNTNLISEKKEDKFLIDYKDINKLILNNYELKSLEELVLSSTFNLASKVSKRYPTLDFQANGLPQYTSGRNYISNSETLKTSQFAANPSLSFRWDLINPLRGSEIKIARQNLKIAKNNYEIKRKDLVKEAKSRFHNYQKSYQDIKNKKFTLDLSMTSLKNAQSKFESGIGTKFEVLEADAQLSRDKQSLNETKIKHRINKISLKEILNINKDFEIKKEQNLIGYWNYGLSKNINQGLNNNLSLKNFSLQKSIKVNKAINSLNANKPNIYITNTFSVIFQKEITYLIKLIQANMDLIIQIQ